MSSDPSAAAQPLRRWERTIVWVFAGALLVFGGVVEMRSAFLKRRMTDADVYFHAAWAVRAGQDIYAVSDTNNWHYSYPPLLAIALVPLANPPPGVDNAGYLPYPVSVAIWYAFGVACLLTAVHCLARGFERHSGAAVQRWTRRWWWLRMATILICLIPAGNTLSRGQINMVVLLCLAAMIALLLARRPILAGLCVAVPISIKVFPAFLLVDPMVRRDWRWLAGALGGAAICLILIPALVFGPKQTVETYARFHEVLIRPALGLGSDAVRERELTGAQIKDSQSFAAVLHHLVYRDPATRPTRFEPWIRAVHWAVGAAFAAVTIGAGLWTRNRDAITTAIFIGALIVVMLPMSPVCHIHYFVLAVPLVMALLAAMWERVHFPSFDPAIAAVAVANIMLHLLSALPGFESWKSLGVPLAATLLLWAAGIRELFRRAARTATLKQEQLA